MSTQFSIRESDRFRDQIKAIVNYYNSQRDGLGNVFFEDVNHLVQVLKTYPGIGVPAKYNRRKIFTARFPFIIYYKLDRDTVLLLAIYHSVRLNNSFM
ncbi:MAG: type II toxin-antitoxin system RelE/ParE family toxin [Bacteroidota bacterium]|jgi:toxin ParE1/3/4